MSITPETLSLLMHDWAVSVEMYSLKLPGHSATYLCLFRSHRHCFASGLSLSHNREGSSSEWSCSLH